LSSPFIFYGLILLLGYDTKTRRGTKTLIGQVLVGQSVTLLLLLIAWQATYRQPDSFFSPDNVAVDIPRGGATLKLPPKQAAFIGSWYSIAEKNDFPDGSVMIDITGRFKGTMFILNGRFPKTPWLYGLDVGDVNGEAMAVESLRKLS
jgi:hypothetical protein